MSPRSRRKKGAEPEALAQTVPGFAVSLFTIVLMWLFAELIFLPLAAGSLAKDLSGRVTSIVAAVFVAAVGSLLPQTARKGDAAVKLLSGVLVRRRYKKPEQAEMRRVFEGLGRALLSALLGIIVSSLFYWIHPVLGGIALLITIIAAFIFIFQAASARGALV